MKDMSIHENGPRPGADAAMRRPEPLLGASPEAIEQFLPENLAYQVENFVGLHRRYNEMVPKRFRSPEEDFEYLEDFFKGFILDRNRRAEEVSDPRYERVVELANTLLPMPTLEVICMDGRVKLIHTNGFSAEIGNSLRTPAGLLKEFVRQSDGKLSLERNSKFARLLLDQLSKNNTIAEVFDSHWFCAARIGEEEATGNHTADGGLFRDILQKKEMVDATKDFAQTEGRENDIAFIQTTFNPITGYLYMGLERDGAIEFAEEIARKKGEERGVNPDRATQYAQYDKPTIKALLEQGEIISTGDFLKDEEIRSAFERNFFNADWQKDYLQTAEKFWSSIEKLRDELLPRLEGVVSKIYPENTDPEKYRLEIEERAMILLTNAFNAFLHNTTHNEMEYLEKTDHEYELEGHYRYGEHSEEGVKVSEGGHPPYDIAMFVVYSGDIENISSRVELASKLVRNNRRAGRVKDRLGRLTNPDEFGIIPVPIVMQEIARNQNGVKISEKDWGALGKIEWDDMPPNWASLTDKEMSNYLVSKGISNHLLIQSVLALREKMAMIYNPSQETSSHIKDLYKIVLPIISDQKRKTHAVIPFVEINSNQN